MEENIMLTSSDDDMTLNELLTGIADGIRAKEGSTDLIPAKEMKPRILGFPTGNVSGRDWTLLSLPWDEEGLGPICYGGGKFVAVIKHQGNTSVYSSDAIVWNTSVLPAVTHWHAVAYGAGKFVAVGSALDKAAVSNDGITWHMASLPFLTDWGSIVYGKGIFIATSYDETKVAYSQDGEIWNESGSSVIGKNTKSIAYGSGKFVTVGYSPRKAAYSYDGIVWNDDTNLSVGYWHAVAYGAGKFVAISSNNEVAYTMNATEWNIVELPISDDMDFYPEQIAYGAGKFVICGDGGYVGYSQDAISWEIVKLSYENFDADDWVYANSISYGAGKFVLIADEFIAYSESS